MPHHNLDIFKSIFVHLKDWYIEVLGLGDDEFNQNNDFSTLKLIKLQFFVVAINSQEDNSLLSGYDFYAMPYGPVETTTYKLIKDSAIEGLNINRYSTEITEAFAFDKTFLDDQIKKSIDILKSSEPNLITADASDLVELSHKWNSWKRNYSLARLKGKFSIEIPDEEIINDNKIISLDLV